MSRRQSRKRVRKAPNIQKSVLDFQMGIARAVLVSNTKNVPALQMLAAALVRSGRFPEALDVDLKIVHLTPEDPIIHYNLACDFSNLKRLDEAFDMLDRAFHLGYRDYRHLLRDEDMSNVRRDPRFRKLLNKRWGKRRPS